MLGSRFKEVQFWCRRENQKNRRNHTEAIFGNWGPNAHTALGLWIELRAHWCIAFWGKKKKKKKPLHSLRINYCLWECEQSQNLRFDITYVWSLRIVSPDTIMGTPSWKQSKKNQKHRLTYFDSMKQNKTKTKQNKHTKYKNETTF